jgi:phosphonatase-like hydrolase
MIKPALIVFDIAGTTVKDPGNVAKSFIDAFQEEGYLIGFEEAQRVMGYKKTDAVSMLLQQKGGDYLNNELVEKIHGSFNKKMICYYQAASDLKPFDDTETVFKWLHENGILIALNTGFIHEITEVILKRLNWETGKMIDAVVSSDEVENGRPAPDMIFKVMRSLGVTDKGLVVKVGDTRSDMDEGHQAGCGLVIGVTTGAYTREALEKNNPDFIIDRLVELKGILKAAHWPF